MALSTPEHPEKGSSQLNEEHQLPRPPPPPQSQTSLPYPDSCLSYWHRTTRTFPYLNHNQTNAVPSSAQYVVIGSGIAGALTAFKLLEAGINPKELLILEAREAVSGSSGRNAGHVRPDAFRGFSGYAAAHGVEQALKIVDNEYAVADLVAKFVHEHDIPCDFSPKPTFDVNITQEMADDEETNVKEFVAAGGSLDGVKSYKGDEAKKRTGVRDALTAWEWPAASIHPAKLTQWMLSSVIERGCKFWTHCPSTAITRGKGDKWNVHTPQGIISAERIVHCTNAYAGVLLPQLDASLLTPIRIQVHSIVPNAAFSGSQALKSTMALRYGAMHFYALIQMPNDGMIIFGVAKATGTTFDESSYKSEIVDEAVQMFGDLFPSAKEPAEKHGEGLDHAWTGLIAMTHDKVPYVGPIDDLPGQYICAGFNGHGMAGIFKCAPGVVSLMLGETWEDTKLPECFQYSHERLLRGQMKW